MQLYHSELTHTRLYIFSRQSKFKFVVSHIPFFYVVFFYVPVINFFKFITQQYKSIPTFNQIRTNPVSYRTLNEYVEQLQNENQKLTKKIKELETTKQNISKPMDNQLDIL